MKLLTKFVLFIGLYTLVWGGETYWLNGLQPGSSAAVAVAQLNGGEQAFQKLRRYESIKEGAHTLALIILILGGFIIFSARGRKGRALALFLTPMLALGISGCVRPYDTPEYVLIDTSETGFLIPLEGNTGDQAKFESEAYLQANKALSEGPQNPVLYQFKVLDVEKARVEKWNGQYPSYYLGTGTGSSGPSMLLQLPPPVK